MREVIYTLYLVSQERPLSGVILSQVAALVRQVNCRPSGDISIEVAYQLPLVDVRRNGICSTAKELEYFRQEAGLSREKLIRLPTLVPTSAFYMPKAITYGLLPGSWALRKIVEHSSFDLIHCRGYLAVLTALRAIKYMKRRPKLIFDMRGLYPLEAIVLGRFDYTSNSFMFWKSVEKEAFRCSTIVFTLSQEMSEYVRERGGNPVGIAPIAYIKSSHPSRAVPVLRHELGIDKNALVFAFSGTLGTWHSVENLLSIYYRLKDHLTRLQPGRPIFLLILSPTNIQEASLKSNDIIKINTSPDETTEILQCADVGLVPLRDDERFQIALDEIARTMGPLKVAEYLVSGLVVVSNHRAKAVSRFLEQNEVGVSYESGQESEVSERLIRFLEDPNIRKKAKAVGESVFGLSVIAEQIESAYKNVCMQ